MNTILRNEVNQSGVTIPLSSHAPLGAQVDLSKPKDLFVRIWDRWASVIEQGIPASEVFTPLMPLSEEPELFRRSRSSVLLKHVVPEMLQTWFELSDLVQSLGFQVTLKLDADSIPWLVLRHKEQRFLSSCM